MMRLLNPKHWFEYLARETTWNRLSQLPIADVEKLAEELAARERQVAALERRVADLGGFLADATDHLHRHSLIIARLCGVLPSNAHLVGIEPVDPAALQHLRDRVAAPSAEVDGEPREEGQDDG